MRKSLLLLLGLTTGWISAIGSNYVLRNESTSATFSKTEQTQTLTFSGSTAFGKFVRNEFALANNVQNCDPAKFYNAAPGLCENAQITWNIPNSGDGEALAAGYPRVFDLTTNSVVAVNPNTQPITLPVGRYQIQYRFELDDECNIPITVRDNQAPTFTSGCGTVLNLLTDANACLATLPTNSVQIPEGADNCSGAMVIWTVTDAVDGVVTDTVSAAGTFYLPDTLQFGLGVNPVLFTIYDASGNTAQCPATITVDDNNIPVFVDQSNAVVDTTNANYPDMILGNDAGTCAAISGFTLPLAYDTCAGMIPVLYEIFDESSNSIATGTGDINNFAFPKGVNTVYVGAFDGVTTPIQFAFTVTVTDTEVPTLDNCPADFTTTFSTSNNGTDDCTAEVTFALPTATDNCTDASNIVINWAILSKDTLNLLYAGTDTDPTGVLEPDTFLLAYIAEDEDGNSSTTCFSKFVVIDDEAPVRIGGAPSGNQTLMVGPACDVTVSLTVPNVGDNSTGCASSPIQGGFFQYFTINETTSGTLVKQDTVSLAATNVSETFPLGSYTVSWIAEDYSGNSATIESFQITVIDDINPTIDAGVYGGNNFTTINMSSFPADVVNNGCELAIVIPGVIVDDNCAVDTVVVSRGLYNEADGTVTDTIGFGTTTYTYTVTDESGNQATATITVTLVDDIEPTLNQTFAYPDIVESAALNKCSFSKSWNVLNFFKPADNCAANLDSLYIVVDYDNDNVTTASDTLIANKVSEIGASQRIDVTFPGPNNTHNVIVKVTDKAGNTKVKSFTVTTTDNQNPVITYTDTVSVFVNSVDCQSATANIFFDASLVSDNCTDDVTLLANMTNDYAGAFALNTGDSLTANFTIEPTPFHSIVFTTLDGQGNSFSKTVVVKVIDEIDPDVDLTPLDTIPNDLRVCAATTKVFAPTSSDACGIETVEYSINGSAFMSLPPNEIEFPYTFPVGRSEIIWMVTDSNNNVTLDTQYQVVIDMEAPYIDPIANQNLVTNPGECGRVFNLDFPTVTDNCVLDTAYFTFSDNNGMDTILPNFSGLSFFVEPGKTYTARVFASDTAGNIDSTAFNIILRDVEAPTMNCPTAELKIDANDPNCQAIFVLMDQFAFDPADNCADFTVSAFDGTQTFDPYANHAFPVGFTTVDLTVTDIDGNDFTCTFDVNVANKALAHVVGFPTDTVLNTTANECSKRYFWSEPRILGNGCNGETVTYTSNFSPGDDFPIDTTVVVYTFERRDGANNLLETVTQSFTIVVQDKQAPVITQVPADKTIFVGADCLALLQYSDIDYQDNCDAQGIKITIADSLRSGERLPVGNYVVNILVEDLSGNAATAAFNVTVRDNIAPTLTVPSSVVNVCGTTAAPSSFVTMSDNCGIGSAVFSPSSLSPGLNNITATVTDVNGNSTVKSFQVNAIENTVATITSAPTTEVCAGSTWTFVANAPGAGETGTWTSAAGNVNIANPNAATTDITFNNPGTFDVIWTLTNPGCAGTTTKRTILVVPNVIASVSDETLAAENNEVTLNGNNAPGIDNGTWSTANNEAIIADVNDPSTLVTSVKTETDFTWTIEIPGCPSSSATVKVIVPQLNLSDVVETGFTPGANANNFWNLDVVKNDADYANGTVIVKNRWGSTVFESSLADYNGNGQWDGTHDGNELPTAAYYFVITPSNSSAKVITGFVTIIR